MQRPCSEDEEHCGSAWLCDLPKPGSCMAMQIPAVSNTDSVKLKSPCRCGILRERTMGPDWSSHCLQCNVRAWPQKVLRLLLMHSLVWTWERGMAQQNAVFPLSALSQYRQQDPLRRLG